ncbi:MAG: 16S rRNA (cytosine(967)-C(5))-methyltransferase RsmB [Clostridia bacterium]|nr:16S rRNA (cytosine(967)-C(5))-methyltransferase RsmB [Clostridia bacterium]
MISAREAALKTLTEVFYKDAFSSLALKERLKRNSDMPQSEKALLTTLVYGVISRHFTLRYIIERYSRQRPDRIDKQILIILELGLYQLLYTDRIPDSAAVNESVKLAKKRNRGASGFVNAVLRSFIRDGKRIDYPKDEIERLGIEHSYSPEMTRLFVEQFGDRAGSVMAALNEPPKLTLRANIMKLSAAELAQRLDVKIELLGGALLAAEGFDVGSSELYKSGMFSVQDAAAYNTAIALDPQPDELIIDMCSAPGGKAAHIAELTGDMARVIACDIYEHKIRLIEDTARRLGLSSIEARLMDGTRTDAALVGAADRVLCDVPCSGLGIIRRKPDIKLGRIDISALPALQSAILKNGANYVRTGGILVYSTCTLNRAENEGVTEALLKGGGFRKLYEKTYMPDTDGTDGFYICKMEKL